jgi:hypothetical protein
MGNDMGFDGCRGWMRYDTSSNLFRSSLEPSLIRYSIKLESCELGVEDVGDVASRPHLS